ncbi:MAG: hypothetical protein MdMp014T_0914 [Treponematales bacterium]
MKTKTGRIPEDYAALEERWTQTAPEADFSRPGVFARQRLLLNALDTVSAAYLQSRAETEHTTPARIIGTLVREKIAVTA